MKISIKPQSKMFDEVLIEGTVLQNYHAEQEVYGDLIDDLMATVEVVHRTLKGRRIWHINSVAFGGGVAEILPPHICLMRELGFDVRWLVFKTDDPEFFRFTKGVHNALHDKPGVDLTGGISNYLQVSSAGALELEAILAPDDIIVVHDPQPLCAAASFLERHPLPAIWRCHIGYPERTSIVDGAWDALNAYLKPFQTVVLSDEKYAFQSPTPISFIQPSICPFSPKNRPYDGPTPPELARQVRIFHGSIESAEDIGSLLGDKYFLHVSRWDALKGIDRAIEAFTAFCQSPKEHAEPNDQTIRLVVAGPDPDSVADDPEGLAYFHHCQALCDALPKDIRDRVALTCISMEDHLLNAEVVGRFQQDALGVFQLSQQEGFGLTSTEALFRGRPLIVSSAFGLARQVTDGLNGTVLPHQDIHLQAAEMMRRLAGGSIEFETMAQKGRETCIQSTTQIAKAPKWLRVIAEAAISFDLKFSRAS